MAKRRLKYTRVGWFTHWLTMRSGFRDWHSGKEYPDEYGAYWRSLWVGPFASAADAIKVVPYNG